MAAALAGTAFVAGGTAGAAGERTTSPQPATRRAPGLDERPTATPIKHFVCLMQENHTFDNYFGTYPRADGIPPDTAMPVDPDDPTNTRTVRPFHIGGRAIEDPSHSQETHALQYNEGRMDGFVQALERVNQDGSIAMGYYDERDIPYYWNLADEFVLFDRFFSSAAGGSLWNHLFWVSGTPGNFEREGVPPEGFGDLPTIFDRLQDRGVSWKFYVQNYDPTINFRNPGTGNRSSQVIWVPLLNFPRFLDDPELASHIVDLEEYFSDLKNGTLPAVAYIAPSGTSEHPPAHPRSGMRFVRTLINELTRSAYWDKSAFLLTYDDWGGWYDHVPPPEVDAYGYGFRVPALLVSSLARRGFTDSTVLDYTSILKFIEENWEIEPLAARDAKANSLASAFDLTVPPRPARIIPAERGGTAAREPRRGIIYLAYGAALGITGLFASRAALSSRRRSPSREGAAD